MACERFLVEIIRTRWEFDKIGLNIHIRRAHTRRGTAAESIYINPVVAMSVAWNGIGKYF